MGCSAPAELELIITNFTYPIAPLSSSLSSLHPSFLGITSNTYSHSGDDDEDRDGARIRNPPHYHSHLIKSYGFNLRQSISIKYVQAGHIYSGTHMAAHRHVHTGTCTQPAAPCPPSFPRLPLPMLSLFMGHDDGVDGKVEN